MKNKNKNIIKNIWNRNNSMKKIIKNIFNYMVRLLKNQKERELILLLNSHTYNNNN